MKLQSLLAAMLLPVSSLAIAEESSLMAQIGWVQIQTHADSKPLQTTMNVLGNPVDFDSPGTSLDVGDADTILLAIVYNFSDHWGLKFEGGYPPVFDLYGKGSVTPPIPVAGQLLSVNLADHRPLAKSRQWSPAMLLQYSFRAPSAKLRPYLGVGVAYFWYTNVDVNPQAREELSNRFGAPLALANLKPGQTQIEAAASPSFAPVINLGLFYQLDQHWGVAASFSYVDLSTESTIDIKAADGSRLARSKSNIDLDPTITALVLSYKF